MVQVRHPRPFVRHIDDMTNDGRAAIYHEVVRANPAQPEFHRATLDVLEVDWSTD
jgi:hypothetical protein